MMNLGAMLDLCRHDEGYREDYLTCLYHYAGMVPEGSIIVEIGCYKGFSALAMASGMRAGSRIYTIDPIFMAGSLTYPDAHHPSVTLHSQLTDVQKLWRRAGVEDRIVAIADYSWNVLDWWNLGAIDLLLIDGEHTFDAVMRDCRWLDLIKPEGYCAVDDWFNEIEMAVRASLEERPEWTILHQSTQPQDGDMFVTLLRKDT